MEGCRLIGHFDPETFGSFSSSFCPRNEGGCSFIIVFPKLQLEPRHKILKYNHFV
jgi:hypothetical protein